MARPRSWGPVLVLGVGMFLCALALILISQHFSFYADEWSFALKRRAWTFDSFLMPHNGHLSLVPAIVYKLLFLVTGLAHSWPYRLVLILLHLSCVGLIYVLASKRIGPWLALVPAGLIILPGTSYDDLLWAFQIGFVGSLAFGLAALVCLDRDGPRGNIAATVFVALSIASSTVGLAFAVGILAELIATRRRRPRLFVALIPLALYGAWFLGFHDSEDRLIWADLPQVPNYDLKAASDGFAGFAHLPAVYGTVLLLGALALLVARIWQGDRLPPRAFVGILGALTFWSLAALARLEFGAPSAGRYVYPSMVFILIAIIPLLRPMRSIPWEAGVVLATVVAAAVISNYEPLKTFADYRTAYDAGEVAGASAEIIADRPGDPWVEMYRALDFPAIEARDLMTAPLDQQLRADETLARADRVGFDHPTAAEVAGATPAPVPDWHSLTESTVAMAGIRCTRLTRTASDPLAALSVPAGRQLLLVRPGPADPEVQIRVRRLARDFQVKPLPIPPDAMPSAGSSGIIRFSPDSSDLPWYARIEFDGPIGLCLV